jgi:hypothetical protein
MAETIDRPSVAKPVSRPRSRKPATVSASALALHLDCSRTYIGKLEAEGVIRRHGDGFPLDQAAVDAERHVPLHMGGVSRPDESIDVADVNARDPDLHRAGHRRGRALLA